MCGTQKLLSHSRHFFTLILGRWFERGDCAITPNLFIFMIPLFIFVIPIIRSLPPSPDKDPDFGIQLSDQVWGLTGLETDMMQIPHQAHKPQLAFYRPVPRPVPPRSVCSFWQAIGARSPQPPTLEWECVPSAEVPQAALKNQYWFSPSSYPSLWRPPTVHLPSSQPSRPLPKTSFSCLWVCVCVCVYVCVHAHAYVCVSVDVGGCVC